MEVSDKKNFCREIKYIMILHVYYIKEKQKATLYGIDRSGIPGSHEVQGG